MLDNILGMVKNTVGNMISNNNAVPEDKKGQTIDTATQAIGDGLKQNLNMNNLSSLTNLFKGGGQASGSNPIVSSITNNVVNALMQKVGLPQSTSNSLASGIVPAVMSMLSGKAKDPNEKGFDLQSLISTFSGGGNTGNTTNSANTNNAGGMLQDLGKLFHK